MNWPQVVMNVFMGFMSLIVIFLFLAAASDSWPFNGE